MEVTPEFWSKGVEQRSGGVEVRSGMYWRCGIELGLNVLRCALAKSSVLLKEAEWNGVQAEDENGVGGMEERRRKCSGTRMCMMGRIRDIRTKVTWHLSRVYILCKNNAGKE